MERRKLKAWECECGQLEYGSIAPKECEKCMRVNSFLEASEEVLNDKENDITEELD